MFCCTFHCDLTWEGISKDLCVCMLEDGYCYNTPKKQREECQDYA